MEKEKLFDHPSIKRNEHEILSRNLICSLVPNRVFPTGTLCGTCGLSIRQQRTEPPLMTAPHSHTVRLITLQSTQS